MGGGSFDLMVMEAVVAHRSSWPTGVARAMMAVGTTPLGLAAGGLLAVAVVLRWRLYRAALAAAVALVVAASAAAGLKQLFGRARPPAELALVHVGGTSFPSTQAADTAAVATALMFATAWATVRAARAAAVGLTVLVALVGVCMVYLGAHWPTDVLAGWLLGGGIGTLFGVLIGAGARLREEPETPGGPGPGPSRRLHL